MIDADFDKMSEDHVKDMAKEKESESIFIDPTFTPEVMEVGDDWKNLIWVNNIKQFA